MTSVSTYRYMIASPRKKINTVISFILITCILLLLSKKALLRKNQGTLRTEDALVKAYLSYYVECHSFLNSKAAVTCVEAAVVGGDDDEPVLNGISES